RLSFNLSARKEEETVYDEVKVQSETNKPTADTNAGVLLDKKGNNRRGQYQQLACCLGILCVILLLGIIAVVVYHQSKITNLTAVNQNLATRNQELETQRNNVTEELNNLKTNCNKVRQCKPCQNGWKRTESNCYAYNNAEPPNQKTWEEAQQDCRGKSSDLAVVHSQDEQTALNKYSVGSSGTDGYWFGLRAEGGRWKWIDGSNLTESYWTPQPPPTATDGQCGMSVQNVGWRSVNCTEKKQWICIMKVLSV
uniref:C-type lectin domain-containing protein n=1 Tax=Sander lucioperca TaxID=283035 RepID=A0A8C9ZGJ2_SANLU